MVSNLKQLECVPDCGFLVRSHDEVEIVNAGISHMTNVHKQNTTSNEVKALIKLA